MSRTNSSPARNDAHENGIARDRRLPHHGLPNPAGGNTRAIAVLRIAVGALFLIFAEYKVVGRGFIFAGGFEQDILGFLKDGAYPFMVPVLRGLVLPHAHLFAFSVAYGELLIGLALVLGVMVRAASVFGLLLMLSILFSSAYPGPHAAFWMYFGASLSNSVFALCFLAFLIGPGEELWSVTQWRKRRSGATV